MILVRETSRVNIFRETINILPPQWDQTLIVNNINYVSRLIIIWMIPAGIYSSCVSADILDEAPFAYYSITEITEQIKDGVSS